MQRIDYVHAALKFLSALFFNSEAVASRSNVLSETSDILNSESWLNLLATDIFTGMFRVRTCDYIQHQNRCALSSY